MSKSKSEKPVKFEDAIEQLESIIERIESGDVGLEDCLTQYEQGMSLIKQCRQVLAKAEKKIAELAPDEKGGLKVEDEDVIEGEED
ncbi:MAG: exodeoxyribonuclease VII small subunit [Phycisphaeraceae bacterium]